MLSRVGLEKSFITSGPGVSVDLVSSSVQYLQSITVQYLQLIM